MEESEDETRERDTGQDGWWYDWGEQTSTRTEKSTNRFQSTQRQVVLEEAVETCK